jgi:hypothetical protein
VNRLLLALTVGAAAVLPAAVLGASSVSAAPTPTIGPVVVGWWSLARPDSAVPAVPPPDAGAEDLYVAGANALPALPTGLPTVGPAGPVAVAALRFELPEGAVAGELRVRLAGVVPPLVTLMACRALGPFSAEYGGSWADAPTYDCTEPGTARLGSDGQVVLDGVDRLRRGSDLSVVLVPGPLDRVILAAPDERTLSVSTPVAEVAEPLSPAAAADPPAAEVRAPGGTGTVALPSGPLPVSLLPVTVPTTAPTDPAAPLVAVPVPTAQAAALPVRPWPALAATLLLALLAFVPLARPGRGGLAAGATAERGVGRFRRAREGRAPELA